jgi:hypothetical protein
MPRRNFLLPAAALLGLMLFFFLLIRLLLLRYERGDIYPPYSTLRADPLGARVYYEALASTRPNSVARGFISLRRELAAKPGTVFYLGLDSYDIMTFSTEEVAQLDAYVRNGGRVVLTFAPEDPTASSSAADKEAAEKKAKEKADEARKEEAKPDNNPPEKAPETDSDQNSPEPQTQQEKYERDELQKEQDKDSKDNAGKEKDDEPVQTYHRSLAALWGFGWDWQSEEEKEPAGQSADSSSNPDADKPEVLALRSSGGNLEPSVPWKSALYLVRLEPEWQDLYDAKTKPVLVRRAWGKGEIIVATDSYLISNEALRNNRRPALLSFLAGPSGPLLFDETHLGTQEQEGVMVLAKRFQLEGYLYGMFGVVLLFLWHNRVPLVPPRPARGQALLGGAVSGKDSHSGLVNLLRRNIAARDILKTSLGEWKRNVTPARRHLYGKMSEMESVLAAAASADPDRVIASYRQLHEINTAGRSKGKYATKS